MTPSFPTRRSSDLPDGVVNAVPGGAETGAALAGHRDVDQLQFVGSAATGRRIMVSAGESNGKPVMLEGGGKSAKIVRSEERRLGKECVGTCRCGVSQCN